MLIEDFDQMGSMNTLYNYSHYPKQMEASIGIENIFNAVRIDYVWRLNYLNHSGIQKSGIRATIALTF